MATGEPKSVNFWSSFRDTSSGFSVVFEDDGRVAYAYLLDASQEIIADVWLYNRCVAPTEPEWSDPSKLPFANPIAFVAVDGPIAAIDEIEHVSVRWDTVGEAVRAHIYVRGVLAVVLVPGAKPGWSEMALRDGPLARVLRA